jgi:hypothetical protein
MRATSLTRTGPACRTFRTFRTAPRRGCDRQDRAHLSPELKSTHWTKHRGPVKAKAGAGSRIMEGKIGDPSYPEDTWAKTSHVHANPDGTSIEVHYWQNLKTGGSHGFKFK